MKAITRWAMAVLAAAGLGIDAYTHLDLAHLYAFNTTGALNEGALFRVEAALAIGAAVWLLVRPALRSAGFAALVAGGGAAVLLIYRYVDVGKIGPVPNMYDPEWFTEKKWSLAGEVLATGAALVLLGALAARGCRPAAVVQHPRSPTDVPLPGAGAHHLPADRAARRRLASGPRTPLGHTAAAYPACVTGSQPSGRLRRIRLGSGRGAGSEPPLDVRSWSGALVVMLALTAALWIVQIVNASEHYSLDRFGLRPRHVSGLWGVLMAPVLQRSYGHLLSDSVLFVAIGWVLLLSGLRTWVIVTAVVLVLGGLATWALAGSGLVLGPAAWCSAGSVT